MSPVIDNRVVEMEFDNSRFERNVSTSISTLDKLKAALRLDGASKGLESIENTSRNFNLANIGNAVSTISSRFSALGVIGTTVLQDIGHKAFEAGERILGMVKSMTIDQFKGGWDKYADKTTAIQTIMAATGETWREDANNIAIINNLMAEGMSSEKAEEYASVWQKYNDGALDARHAAKELSITQDEFLASVEKTQDAMKGFDGSQMDYVNEQMEKLNWFTDETSYNFTDMVSNIGKFTANQIPLSQATTAMQGIATWAAISGQNAGAASRAMYNMAQAIGVGSVKLMDWKSIENANMATADFKQHAMDAAVAVGILTKGTDGLYRTTKGTEVNVRNFSQTLSEGWFNKDVLLSTLDAYGGFTDALYDVSSASGLTATELLGLIDAQEKGTLTQAMINEAAADSSMSAETLAKKVQELAGAEYDLGRKSFKAAQEAKTFQDAIDATKDAASTRWMNIFENIFGDYERAKEVWTGFAEFLYDTLVAPLEKVEELSEAFQSPLDRFSNSLSKASKATKLSNAELLELAKAQKDGTLTQEQLNEACKKGGIEVDDLNSRLEELNSNERLIGIIGEDGSKSVGTFTDSLFELADATGLSADEILTLMQAQQDGTLTNEQLAAAAEKCGMSIEDLGESISNLAEESSKSGLDRIVDGVKSIIDILLTGGDREDPFQRGILGSFLEGFHRIIPPMELTKTTIENLINRFRNWASELKLTGAQMSLLRQAGQGVASILQFLSNTIKNFWDATSNLRASLKNLAEALGNLILKLFGSAKDMDTAGISADGFRKICDKVASVIEKIATAIEDLNLDELKEKFSGVTKVLQGLKTAFDWVVDKLTNIDFAGGIGKAVDWLSEKFGALKETLKGFDWGKIFKGLAGGGVLTLIGTKIFKALIPKKGFLEGIKEKITGVLEGIKDALGAFEAGIKVDSIKKIAEAIAILAVALLILGFVNYDNAVTGLLTIAGILGALYLALQNIDTIDKAKMATLAASMLVAAAAMLVLAVALAVLAGALALFALVAKMDTVAEGLLYMAATLAIAVVALQIMSNMSPKVIIAAAALLIMAVAMLVLAGALAAFAAVAKMDTIAEGLLYMAATLAIAVAALMVLADQAPGALVAAAALLVLSAALLLMAGALFAFAEIATMATAGEGLGMLITMLAALTIVLLVLSENAVGTLAAAASLLVVAAACLVLAAAVAVVALALPLLAAGLAALGAAIGSALTSIGQGAQDFLVSLSDALVAIGDALAEIISSIGEALGDAVSSLGEGIGEAITAIIASVGEGIGQGITAISDSIGTFGENLTNAGLGIENFGNSIRSLEGIAWTSTAVGIGELAVALGKLKANKLANTMGPAAEAVTTMCTDMVTAVQTTLPQMETAGQDLLDAVVSGMNGKASDVNTTANAIATSGASGIVSAYATWYRNGAFVGQGFVNGINSKLAEVQAAAEALANAAADALAKAAEIKSPSRVAARLGGFFGEGFVNGIDDKVGAAERAAETMVNRTANTLSNARSLISGILEDDFTPVISPVLDTSSIDSSLAGMSALSMPVSGSFVQRTSASVMNPAQIQNGTPAPVTAVLSESAARALAGSHSAQQTPVIEFSGDLAQLARILQPHIKMQDNYHGKSLVR